jgi:hypothetical protein
MLDLRRADPERERAEGAVRRGMAVAADDRHPRLRSPLLGPDDMDDTPARIAHREILDPEPARIVDQRLKLRARLFIGDAGGSARLTDCRHIMVRQRQRAIGPPYRAPRRGQPRERLRRGHLVEQVQIDIEQGLAIILGDGMRIPDLVIERAAHDADQTLPAVALRSQVADSRCIFPGLPAMTIT